MSGVRAASPARNGLPEPRPYVYRGTGRDVMPWAVTSDTRGVSNEDAGLPSVRQQNPARNRCGKCGYLYRAVNHKILCRGAA